MKSRQWLASLLCLLLVMAFAVPTLADSADIVNMDAELPIVKEPLTLKMWGQQGSIQKDWKEMDLWIKYQEISGITLDITTVPTQGYEEAKNLMFASGDSYDMLMRCWLSPAEIVRYGSMGVLMPLEDLIPTYAPNFQKLMDKYPSIAPRITAPDGHIYALPAIIEMDGARTEKFWINTTWLEQAGKEIPTTFDELEEVLRAFKGVDFNGNGEADEIPFGGADTMSVINNLVGCWGLPRQFDQNLLIKDGKVEEWLTSETFHDVLRWTNKMYSEGLMDSEMFTQEYAKFNAKMSGQVMGFFFNMAADAFDPTHYKGIAPFAGKSDAITVKSAPIARDMGCFAIMADCKYPEAALRFQDYFYSDEGSYLMRYGIEGKTWTRDANGLPVYADGILNHPDGAGTACAQFTIWPGAGAPQYMTERNCAAVVNPATAAGQEALNPFMDYSVYPALLFDQDTSDRLVILNKDLNDYLKQTCAKFVNGDLSLETDWATYVDTLKQIGIEEFVSIYQTAYDNLNK